MIKFVEPEMGEGVDAIHECCGYLIEHDYSRGAWFVRYGDKIGMKITYCPYCGIHLNAAVRDSEVAR